jgi:hypothetical protein
MHPAYAQLIEKAASSHRQFRSPTDISAADVGRARLYCYAFRGQSIGAFHATRAALEACSPAVGLSAAWRQRATEVLVDLANQGMEPVPDNFRAVIATLYRYHLGIERVIDSLARDRQASGDPRLAEIEANFRVAVDDIRNGCGIHVAQDLEAPKQASFVVPNLGIIIVPLVYGDHHSWNLAYLTGQARDVPVHRHHHGVEIHLGYNPTHGITILGKHRAQVDDGYAMPIPPETYHGWVNTSETPHHVPFIFGSSHHGGWGIFLDVEAQTAPWEETTRLVARDSAPFTQMVWLEREIGRAEQLPSCLRRVLIAHSVTDRQQSGGLELGLLRVNPSGLELPRDEFRIVSIVRGEAVVAIDGIEREVAPHDHFGVPRGMLLHLRQKGEKPLVALDALLRRANDLAPRP